MEIDPYYEPSVYLEEPQHQQQGEAAGQVVTSLTAELSSVFNSTGWFKIKSEDYCFPDDVSEDKSSNEEQMTLASRVFGSPETRSAQMNALANSLYPLGNFRRRESWNNSFTSMMTALRLVGKNPLLSTLSVPTLQLLTDQISIPSWMPTLPPGVGCTPSQHPSGEWLFPAETGLKIRKNAHPDSMRGRYILYVHGGAFCCCHTGTHRGLLHCLVHQTGASLLSVNYRRPPDHPFPTPVHDCLSAYLFLLEKVGDSRQIFFAGDSAGGNLVINTLILAAQHGLPQPAGAVLLSPWVDLTDCGRCASWEEFADVDYLSPDLADIFAKSYAGDSQDVQSLSPLYSSLLHLLPPLLVEFGECEVLHDQILAFCEAAKRAGVDIRYQARADMVHVFPIYAFSGMQQCQDAFDEIVAFLDEIACKDGESEGEGERGPPCGSESSSSDQSVVLVDGGEEESS
mmetsp:Transcript_25270/g.47254  ORF Transcript_25270/g.47254 Transcript_25270/m.47254 type:complete len:456 (+) Transcript_25270:237-1604(+)